MPRESSVDDIVRNYSPHLSPNTRSASPTAELRKILVMAAEEMLESFLRKWKVKRKLERDSWKDGDEAKGEKGKGKAVNPTYPIVDTVLVKLYAKFEKMTELYALLQEPNYVILPEVEEALVQANEYNALNILYKQKGEDLKRVELFSKLIDGDWTDERIVDPISELVGVLQEKKDRALTQKWAVWLMKTDPARGVKLLTMKDTGKRREKPEEDLALLKQVREANSVAGEEFLEYLVLQRKSSSRELHTQLALSCLDKVLWFLENDSVSKLWRAKASSYASSSTPNQTSFLSYFASTTPESEHKRARLKLILFLAGSALYDPLVVKERISGSENLLRLETVIVDGKLGDDQSVLTMLVHDVGDTVSAEVYCVLDGEVVPKKLAMDVAESCGLGVWVSGLFLCIGGKGEDGKQGKKAFSKERKRELLRMLLEVQMNDAKGTPARTARLLSSQAVNLDTVDVVSLVPPDWPLQVLSSFLARSFRRTLHSQHEGKIIKNISAGQNLEVKDRTWYILREEGYDIEEAVEDEGGDGSGGGEMYDEKGIIVEKLAAQIQEEHENLGKSGRRAGDVEAVGVHVT
ncbi:hypothetical protein AX17_003940 [Amanita inopinata Kibby_2008]|nr:hypothetical protein AX17_003940 [Amanita inopinata Kibby_2008]